MSSVQLSMVAFAALMIATLALASARPSSFAENNQVIGDSDPANNLVEGGLKPWQMEMLVQRLSEMNQQQGGGGGGYWPNALRSPENKRQSRYRQCYFNPISCFKK